MDGETRSRDPRWTPRRIARGAAGRFTNTARWLTRYAWHGVIWCGHRAWWCARWMKHCLLLIAYRLAWIARWAKHWTLWTIRGIGYRLAGACRLTWQRTRWCGGWLRHGIVWAARWTRHWILLPIRLAWHRFRWVAGWTRHGIVWTARWTRHWILWTARWTRHWILWTARWTRYWLFYGLWRPREWLRHNPFVQPRLGRLVHHHPRPMRIPEHYVRAIAPIDPPRISIVTPSFNHAPMLARTICSVIDQGYGNLEYIVQDGDSQDGSTDVLRGFDGRLASWESVPDNGQADAINRGFRRSTGNVMAYLNSDDLLLPGSLAYVARVFATRPDIDVIYGHRVLVDEEEREIGRWVLPPHDDRVLSWADFIPQETLFWRRGIWERSGGELDESFHFALDWDLLLRFRDAGARFLRVPRFLGAFRVHPLQKTSAAMEDIGRHEMQRLRHRSVGFEPGLPRIGAEVGPYLARHLACHCLYRAGVLRY